MENRNKDRDKLEKNRERESGLPGQSSPGSQSDRGSMDRSTRGGTTDTQSGSQSGSQSPSSNTGSQSGSDRSRSRDDESEIGSPGRGSDR